MNYSCHYHDNTVATVEDNNNNLLKGLQIKDFHVTWIPDVKPELGLRS